MYKIYLTEISKKSKNVYNTQYESLVNINNPLNILPSSEQTISSPLHHTPHKTKNNDDFRGDEDYRWGRGDANNGETHWVMKYVRIATTYLKT